MLIEGRKNDRDMDDCHYQLTTYHKVPAACSSRKLFPRTKIPCELRLVTFLKRAAIMENDTVCLKILNQCMNI